MYRFLASAALLVVATQAMAQSTTVYRCPGPNGETVFSQTPCAATGAEELLIHRNEIGGTLGPSPGYYEERAAQERRQALQRLDRLEQDLAEARANAPCKEFSSGDLRTLRIRRQVVPGMPREDAVKSWGAPTRINGTQYAYHWSSGISAYFYIENGCVRTVQGYYGGRT